jgi:hypothetical protein
MRAPTVCFLVLSFACYSSTSIAQNKIVKDTIIYRTIFRDTIVYRYDTVRIKHFVHSDTVWSAPSASEVPAATKKKGLNPNSWGIGPSLGAYYSPYNGFDINIGFGIQYYLFAIPTIKNPHTGHKKKEK